MPAIQIEVRRRYTEAEETALLEQVHGAISEAFKLPAWDRNIRLVVHEPHRFPCPPGKERPEYFTHISIDAFAGRSLDAKRALYQGVVRNLETLGIPRDHVNICVREIPPENWGIRGGQAACDVDIGFSLAV